MTKTNVVGRFLTERSPGQFFCLKYFRSDKSDRFPDLNILSKILVASSQKKRLRLSSIKNQPGPVSVKKSEVLLASYVMSYFFTSSIFVK